MARAEVSVFGSSLAAVARAFPQAISIFEDAGIDFSCGGARSFAEAELAAGFEVDELRALIESAPPPADSIDWGLQSVEALTQYLSEEHDVLCNRTLPAARALMAQCAAASPSLTTIRRVGALLSRLAEGMAIHTANESFELFPRIAEGEQTLGIVSDGHLSQLVLRELVEHESFREQLRTMRELCHQMREGVAEDVIACIDDLSRVIHFHMHLENNLLYPRAVERENRARRRRVPDETAH